MGLRNPLPFHVGLPRFPCVRVGLTAAEAMRQTTTLPSSPFCSLCFQREQVESSGLPFPPSDLGRGDQASGLGQLWDLGQTGQPL